MRLFEVDQGGAREVMAVLQGLANKPGQEQASNLPWPVVKGILDKFSLGISTPDGFIALKNEIDPQGDVIKDIDSETGEVTLNTRLQNHNDQQDIPKSGPGPSVSKMASHNAKNAFK